MHRDRRALRRIKKRVGNHFCRVGWRRAGLRAVVKFTEEVYGVPSLNGVDVPSDDLSDRFDFSQKPRAFTKIAAPQAAAFFLQDHTVPQVPPDDD